MPGKLPLLELRPGEPPSRSQLLAAVAARLHQVVPGFRPVAEDLLGDTSRIDVFGVADDGTAVIALIGSDGEDLTLVARALAQREWLAPRLSDWLKLAPHLGVRVDGTPRALVLCPHFGTEARAAARAAGGVQLVGWHFVRNGSAVDLLLDPLPPEPGPARPAQAPPPPAPFRTGLSDADLGLSDAERADFD